MEILKQIKIAIRLLLLMTIITGIIYPGLVTIVAQILFPSAANGSLIKHQDKVIGSQWIGQSFTHNQYFWGRPSATTPYAYNSTQSSGANFSAMNPTYLTDVKSRIDILKKSDPSHQTLIPVDLVTTSASGLDPEISPYAALYQVPRVAKARKIPEQELIKLVQTLTIPRSLGVFGEARINVLQLNLALDNRVTHA